MLIPSRACKWWPNTEWAKPHIYPHPHPNLTLNLTHHVGDGASLQKL